MQRHGSSAFIEPCWVPGNLIFNASSIFVTLPKAKRILECLVALQVERLTLTEKLRLGLWGVSNAFNSICRCPCLRLETKPSSRPSTCGDHKLCICVCVFVCVYLYLNLYMGVHINKHKWQAKKMSAKPCGRCRCCCLCLYFCRSRCPRWLRP